MAVDVFVIFVFSLIGILVGGNITIKGLKGIGESLHISDLFIGLTIAAFGTSLPETFTNINAGIKGASGIAIGNIVGSNIANITLILGIVGLFHYFKISRKTIRREGLWIFLALIVMWLTVSDLKIMPYEGILMIFTYIIFIMYMIWDENITIKTNHEIRVVPQAKRKFFVSLGVIIIGFILLIGSSNYLVDSSIQIARLLGIREIIVGIILVGVGTSLPELILSVESVIRGRRGIGIGTLLGSNITNPLLPLGAGALFGGVEVGKFVPKFDLPVLFIISSLVLYFLYKLHPNTKEKYKIFTRGKSLTLIGIFLIYCITRAYFFK